MKLFLDIETAPQYSDPLDNREHFDLFQMKFLKDFELYPTTEDWVNHYHEKAALYAEFGKIVCVSMGYVADEKIVLKSYCGDDEQEILRNVCVAISKATSLVAHNGKDFDYPILCRRMIINGIQLPGLLQIQNLKPWEIKLEDTIEMWRFGQFSHRASLACLCSLFGLQSPKQEMDGSSVAKLFYEKDWVKIARYCEGDVTALINVYRKMQYQNPIL